MKKIIVAALILTIVLFIFPVSSFAWEGCVIRNKGDIHDLDFLFDPPLDLELPIGTVYVTEVIVQASGKEKASITPFDQYIYESTLNKGWKHSKKGSKHSKKGSKHSKKGIIIADTEYSGPLEFEFKEARIFESFFLLPIDGEVGVAGKIECEKGYIDPDADDEGDPETLQLYFEVKEAKLVDLNIPGVKFNLVLKIDADPDSGFVSVEIDPLH
jgi:hypothetical protein